MASLRDIRKRIRSVKNTQKITKAMKMVAAAKLRQAQEGVESSRPYSTSLREMLSAVSGAVEAGAHPLLEQRPVKRVDVVFMSSDRGLCGAFNNNVNKAVDQALASVDGATTPHLRPVGRKARDFARRTGAALLDSEELSIESPSYADAVTLGNELVERFRSGQTDEVRVVFTRFRSALSQDVMTETLLPVPATEVEGEGGSADYIFEASREQVLGDLLPRYVNTTLYNMMLESSASEHGSRMTAMDSASTNAAEMIDRLTLTYNRLRQAAITTELMEIIGGAEALKG